MQLHLLDKACREFDAGDLHEVRSIARALRVILARDDRGDPCLLERAGHIGKKLPDTRMLTHPRNLAPELSLTGIVFGPYTIGVRALLEDAGSNGDVTLATWTEQIFANDNKGTSFSRLILIKAVANLAGGTHYPSYIRDYYYKIESLGIAAGSKGKKSEIVLRDVEKHSRRQIAFELMYAFGKTDGKGVRAERSAFLFCRD